MSKKPIFVATHPRACSTAFERVFMTRHDTLTCVHEPFGDAFYYGPERLSERYEKDETERIESGFSDSTYKTILDRIEREGSEVRSFPPSVTVLWDEPSTFPFLVGKRLFIKDITHYLVPPNGKPASIAPSLLPTKKGVGTEGSSILTTAASPSPDATAVETNGSANTNGANGATKAATKPPYPYATAAEPDNPTVVPAAILAQFHFTFLIRHPRSSIPSYYRCTIPPLDRVTGFYDFMPSEAGYDELRRVFDYLRHVGQIGPKIAGRPSDNDNHVTNGVAHDDDDNDDHVANGNHTYANGNGNNPTTAQDANDKAEKLDICVIDADDLLDNPAGILAAYCRSVGLDYADAMLKWDTADAHARAAAAFDKWKGFHEDAIQSGELKARDPAHQKPTPVTEAEKRERDRADDEAWREKFGEEAAKVIRSTVDANVQDYEYLKGFALKV